MKKTFWLFLALCLSLLISGDLRAEEVNTYNGKMNLLMQNYLQIQKALANDSLEGIDKCAHNLVSLVHEIELLASPKLPEKGNECLDLIKRGAKGLASNNIIAVRRSFKDLSRLYIDYLGSVGLPDSLKNRDFYVYYSPENDASWLQDSQNMANPFYGQVLSKSGRLQEKLQSSTTAFNGF